MNETNQHNPIQIPGYMVTGEKLMNMNITEIPYLIEGILQRFGLAAIGGSSDTGKSTWLRQLCNCIVLGLNNFMGFKLNIRYKRAIYVSTEDDETATAYVLRQQNGNEVQSELFKDLYFIFDTDNILHKLEESLQLNPVDVIVIDAFADLFAGDFNGVGQIRNYLHRFAVLAAKYDCLILFLHHTGKRTENLMPSKSNLLGSQGFEAKMRWVGEFRKDPNDHNLRHLCIVKGNYVMDEEKTSSYELSFKERVFEFTGNRIPFHKLIKDKPKDALKEEILERVNELRKRKISTRKASEELKRNGIDISKSTVDNMYKQLELNEYIEGKENPIVGQDDEIDDINEDDNFED